MIFSQEFTAKVPVSPRHATNSLFTAESVSDYSAAKNRAKKKVKELLTKHPESVSTLKAKAKVGELIMHQNHNKRWFKVKASNTSFEHYHLTGPEVQANKIIDDMFNKLD